MTSGTSVERPATGAAEASRCGGGGPRPKESDNVGRGPFHALLGALALSWAAVLAPSASAELSKYFDPNTMMRISEMQPGMRGTCRTVFQGTEPEEFTVEIVRVLRKFDGPADYVLFRAVDGPLVERHSCVARGMSGSPVYINGRLAGAASRAVAITKEPLAAFTPIEYMLECWDEMDREEAKSAASVPNVEVMSMGRPLTVDGRQRDLAVVCNTAADVPTDVADRAVALVPCEMPLVLSGIPDRVRDTLRSVLEPRGFRIAGGIGGSSDAAPYEVKPGSAIGLGLMAGDFEASGGGTVTYISGDRFVAFGHPMFGDGKIDLPAAYMDVAGFVVQEADLADKIMLPIDAAPMGTVLQDRNYSIAGTIGTTPQSFPVDISVHFPARNIDRDFHVRVCRDRMFSPLMCATAAMSALAEYLTGDTDLTVTSDVTVVGESGIKIALPGFEYTKSGQAMTVPLQLLDAVSLLMTNIFEPDDVVSATIELNIAEANAAANLLRLELDDWIVEAGETARVKVVYQLTDGQGEAEQVIEIPIPADHPGGATMLQVAGGTLAGDLELQNGVMKPTPTSLPTLAGWYTSQATAANKLVAVLLEPDQTFISRGVAYPSIPADIMTILTSAGTTDYASSAQVRRLEWDTQYDVMGMLTHPLVVFRPEDRYAGVQDGTQLPEAAAQPPQPGGGLRPPSQGPMPRRTSSATPDLWSRYLSAPAGLVEAAKTLGVDVTPRPTGATPPALWSLPGLKVIPLQGPPPPGIHMPDDAIPGKVTPSTQPSSGGEGPSGPAAGTGGEGGPGGGPEGTGGEEGAGEIEPLPVKGPSSWIQHTAADFSSGYLDGTVVLDAGQVSLAASPETVLSFCPPALYAWCAVPDGSDGLFVGTGPEGVVYRVTADGKATEYYRADDADVFSLATASDGSLVVGTGPRGLVCVVGPDGKERAKVETGQAYVWHILQSGDNLVLATGPAGKILSLGPDGHLTELADLRDEHALCITQAADGAFYVGTEKNNLYRLTVDGFPRPVGASPLGPIHDVTIGPDANVYFASVGNAYKLKDGAVLPCIETSDEASFALTSVSGAVLLATSGAGRVYSVDGADKVRTFGLLPHPEGRLMDLVADDGGRWLWAVSSDPIAVYKLPVTAGTKGAYMSRVLDAGNASQWLDLEFDAIAPEGTSVKVETRSGNEAAPNDDWSDWMPVSGDGPRLAVNSPAARYLQYRVSLEAESATDVPTVGGVEVRYLTINRKPKITYDDFSEVRFIGKEAKLSWEASDPDDDTMRYRVEYSSDRGLTWAKAADEITETSYTWAAGDVPAGAYLVKITASDEVTNPGRGQESSVIIGPVEIDPDAPKVLLGDHSVTVENGVAKVRCSASDKGTGLKLAQYRIDETDPWRSIAPSDLLFDRDYEVLEFTVDGLKPGEHTLEVAAFDLAGNHGLASVKFTIPGEAAAEPEAPAEEDKAPTGEGQS